MNMFGFLTDHQGKQVLPTNKRLLETLDLTIQAFNQLTIPDGIYAYQLPEILMYLTSQNMFSLELKKEKGKGILYGKKHIQLRQAFFNGLSQEMRLDLIRDKLRHHDLFSLLEQSGVVQSKELLLDVRDIGMGHSVYRLQFEQSDVVIKACDKSYTQFYSRILNVLSLPVFPVYPIRNAHGVWEVTPYLSGVTLNDALMKDQTCSDALLSQLAVQAAVGDLFGRGDRHFENYIVKEGVLYPLDISFIFWKGNEDWVQNYIKGGMAEYAVMSLFLPDLMNMYEKMKFFWEVYSETWSKIRQVQRPIQLLIEDHKRVLPDHAMAYVMDRLKDAPSYIQLQQKRYNDSLKRLLDLSVYKTKLVDRVYRDPEFLNIDPFLKMYYLSDQDRMNTFFLLDKWDRQDILKQI